MKKKFLLKGLLVSFMLLCSAQTWAYDFEVDNIQYTITSFDDMTVEVSGLTNTNVIELIIPETVEYRDRTLTVTSIGSEAFRSNETLEYASISNTVTSIGKYAFSGCSALKEVIIGEGVTSIGGYAFRNCSSLPSVIIPNSVTTIGSYAFEYCSSLKEVTIPNSVTTIGSYAFEYCSSLKDVTIGNSVESIRDYVFYKCSSLTEITIPNSVTSIGSSAFRGCTSLAELDIPNSVTSISDEAFVGCSSLDVLYVGAGCEYLKEKSEYKQSSDSSHSIYYFCAYPILWTNGPSKMSYLSLKDGSSPFSVRGLSDYGSSKLETTAPTFSYISIKYFYVGRPLTDIKEWDDGISKSQRVTLKLSNSQPYGQIETLEIGGYCTDVPYFYQSVEKLILGEDVATFTASNIYQGELTSITCRSATPPTVSGTFGNNTYLNVVLYVPIGSKETYQAAEGWRNFWNMEEADVSGIEGILNSGEVTEIARYTVSGQKITTPQKGINIVRYSDGTTRKILVQ